MRAHGPYDLVLLLDGLSELVAGTVRDLAAAAGYARAGALALDDDVSRLYRLVP